MQKRCKGLRRAERTNKKAEVIAMMKRAKDASLAKIVAATNWQKHTMTDRRTTVRKRWTRNLSRREQR